MKRFVAIFIAVISAFSMFAFTACSSDLNTTDLNSTDPDTTVPDTADPDNAKPVTEANSVYAVGDTFRDFTLKKFFANDDDATYTLSDDLSDGTNEGKIVILNFWYIQCGSCEVEIPHFLELAADENYKDKVSLVIIHRGGTTDNAETIVTNQETGIQMPYLEYYVQYEKGWINSYQSATWCMDTDDEDSIFLAAGGSSGYPVTAILDSNGVVQFSYEGGMSKDKLYEEVDRILALET